MALAFKQDTSPRLLCIKSTGALAHPVFTGYEQFDGRQTKSSVSSTKEKQSPFHAVLPFFGKGYTCWKGYSALQS